MSAILYLQDYYTSTVYENDNQYTVISYLAAFMLCSYEFIGTLWNDLYCTGISKEMCWLIGKLKNK